MSTIAPPTRRTPVDDLRTLYTAAPERSLAPRMEALEKANQIRTQRAQLKRDVKAGREDVAGLLLAPPHELDTMKVLDLLLATPKIGRVKAARALAKADRSGRPISPSKTVAGLSDRQRRELVAWMRRH